MTIPGVTIALVVVLLARAARHADAHARLGRIGLTSTTTAHDAPPHLRAGAVNHAGRPWSPDLDGQSADLFTRSDP